VFSREIRPSVVRDLVLHAGMGRMCDTGCGPGFVGSSPEKKRTSRIMHAALRFPDIRAHADVMLPDLCVSMQHAEILGED
jgi:hypothetical protein